MHWLFHPAKVGVTRFSLFLPHVLTDCLLEFLFSYPFICFSVSSNCPTYSTLDIDIKEMIGFAPEDTLLMGQAAQSTLFEICSHGYLLPASDHILDWQMQPFFSVSSIYILPSFTIGLAFPSPLIFLCMEREESRRRQKDIYSAISKSEVWYAPS